MADRGASVTQSDPALLADIRRYGKFDTTGCYQCGSCTLSCELVSDFATFPRKSIRYALLGLRRPLVGGLEPWVCHDCGDCSLICPRQAEPRISMMSLRRFLTAQYDWTGLSARLLRSRAWHIGALVFVFALALALLLGYHLWYVELPFSGFIALPMGMEHMFPIMLYYTLTVMLLPLFLLLSRIYRIWRLTMGGGERPRIPLSFYLAEAATYVKHSAAHTLLRKCPDRTRWLGHWLLAAGTTMMLAVKVFALQWFQTDNLYPLYHPQRWLGYLATAFILYGLAGILVGRIRAQKEFYKHSDFEHLIFPVLLLLTALTGIAAHILRYMDFALSCHIVYAFHVLIATPMLVVEMSFGAWSHMIYRPLALYFLAVKERARGLAPAKEELGYVH
jgi:heterodisulfide reductase subunit C/quinone-modifying oxidoreductase subunit QmoC